MSLGLLNLLLVLLAALGGGAIARKFRYPSILGELAAGIILGPPLLALLSPDEALTIIGEVGVILLMLYIGLHLNPSSLGRVSGPGLLAALGGFLVPAGLGYGLMMLVDGDPIAASFVAVAMGVTSLATKSRILVDLGILNTRIAHVLIAGALFSDIAALILFAMLLGLAATGAIVMSGVVSTLLHAAVFLGGALLVGGLLFPLAGKYVKNKKIDTSVMFLGIVVTGVAFAEMAEFAGLHGILGAFLGGLFIREGVLSKDQLVTVEKQMKTISVGLLAPVFFVTAGFNVTFDVFTDSPLLFLGVFVLATVGKVFGTALFYLPTGYGFREGLAVGAGMNGRGAVEIIVAEIAVTAGIIDTRIFSILVFMAVFTTATVPVLLTMSIDWLRRRGELVADERDGVLFIGAGPVARRMAETLADHAPLTMVDTNAENVAAASDLCLDAIKGNALDADVMEEALAELARTLVVITPNAEVNLLAAQMGRKRFGIPEIYVAMPEEATASMIQHLDDIDAELLFGRVIHLETWDVAVAQGDIVDLNYTMAQPEDIVLEPSTQLNDQADLESLPLLVVSSGASEVFSTKRALSLDEEVVAIGKVAKSTTPAEPAGRGNMTEGRHRPRVF